MRQPDFEVEDPPAMDAHQVLDESPKSNPDISSDGWVGEGQGKMPVGSQNTVCEQLNGLNPSNGLLEQSDLCVQEELGEDANSGICMEEELPTLAGYSKALGLKSAVPELKVPNLLAHQIPKNLGWKEAIGFCELVFDPGILGPRPSTLQPNIVVFNSILNAYVPSHQRKAVSWVLEQLKKGGLKTNSDAYGLAMEVMLHSKKYDLAHELFEKVSTSPRGKEACSGNGDSPPAPDRHADGAGLETSGHAHQWDENVTVPDAIGKSVMPGGIDLHTHLPMELETIEDFFSGQAAVLAGEAAMHIDLVIPVKGSLIAGLENAAQRNLDTGSDYPSCQAMEIKHVETEAWQNLANFYTRLESWADAEACDKRAKSIDFYSPHSWLTAGILLKAQSLYRDALAVSHALVSKLQFPRWQVRMKAVGVLDDKHFAIIASYFSGNTDIVIKCSEPPQASLREKANRVLGLLGGGQSGRASEKVGKAEKIVVEMPGLIDSGDNELLGVDDIKQARDDQHVSGVMSGSLDTSEHRPVEAPSATVAFHAGDDRGQWTDLFAGIRVGENSNYFFGVTSGGVADIFDIFGSSEPLQKQRCCDRVNSCEDIDECKEKEAYQSLSAASVFELGSGYASLLVCVPTASNWVVSFKELISSLQECFEKMEHSYLIDRAHGCCSFVFDPGILGNGQHLPQPNPLVLMYDWLAEFLAVFALSVIRLVFDPGGIAVDTHALQLNSLEGGNEKIHPQRVNDADMDEQGQLAAEPVALWLGKWERRETVMWSIS